MWRDGANAICPAGISEWKLVSRSELEVGFAIPACARKLGAIRNGFDVRQMRPRALLSAIATLSVRAFILIPVLAIFSASQGWAASAIVRDGGTVQLAGVTYRLDGIDAPELDQMCIDEHADAWACGVEAREQLASLIGGRQVRCEDLGLGTTYKKRHIGICTVEGETASLNQLLVRQGFALNFEPYARGTIQRRRSRREGQAPGTLERLLCSSAGIPPRAKGRRLVGRLVQARQGSRNTRRPLPG